MLAASLCALPLPPQLFGDKGDTGEQKLDNSTNK